MTLDLSKLFRATNPSETLNIGKPEDRKYYIDFSSVKGKDIIKDIKSTITSISPNTPTCHLLSGPIGCGKSTELLRLKYELEQEGFHVIYFESAQDLNLIDVEMTDLLLAIARRVSESLENAKVKLQPQGFQRLLQEAWEILQSEIEFSADSSILGFGRLGSFRFGPIGFDIENKWSLSVGIGQISAQRKKSPKLRSKLRQYLEPHTDNIIDIINQELLEPAIKTLKQQGKQGLVVIVDNLDRIDNRPMPTGRTQPEYLFVDRGEQLKSLNCHLVYTIPLVLAFSNERETLRNCFGVDLELLPMVQVQSRDGRVYEEGVALLGQMVLARAFPEVEPQQRLELITELFDSPETLGHLCLISGGHMRYLLVLLRGCLQNDDPPFSRKCLEEVIRKARDRLLLAVTEYEWELLLKVKEQKKITGEKEYQTLLGSLLVSEYRDEEGSWFDINPILASSKEFLTTDVAKTDITKNYKYQVGGCLSNDSLSYITRQADEELYTALKDGEFCYVFSERQTGKSSLRVRTKPRLEKEGFICAAIDLTLIGNNDVTPKQWYYALVRIISRQLLKSFNITEWIKEQDELSPVQVFRQFIDDVLLVEVQQPIVIFIDEIDVVLSLEFSTDDLFYFIRACYEMRSSKPEYQRLNFVLLGLVNPSDLIQNTLGSPLFNIGRAIKLEGFKLHEIQSLAEELTETVDNPQEVLKQILAWTGGQPFLTQKLCQCVVKSDNFITAGSEAETIEQLVRQRIIEQWEEQEYPEHLRTIRDRLLASRQNPIPLLELYQQILQQGEVIADNSPEQTELRLSGIVVRQDGKLRVKNRIYQEVFNQSWLDECWYTLQPVINQPKNTYRLLINSLQNQLYVGQRSHLQIELQPTTLGQDTIELPNDIAELYCFISTNGLQVIGSEVVTMQLDPKTGHPLPVSFEVQAYLRGTRTYTIELFVEDPDSGKTSIFQYSDRVIVKPPEALEPQPPPLPTLDIPVAPPFVLQVETDLPDGDDGSHHLSYYLTTRLTNLQLRHQPVGNVVLSAADLAKMRSLLTQTLQQANHFSPEDARERLISLGSYFFDLFFPADTAAAFRETFWQIFDQISTWLIIEDGITWLPWELVVPYQEDHTTPWRFWGEQYRLSRWIQGLGIPFYNEVPFSEVAFTHYQACDAQQQDEWERLLQAHSRPEIQQVVNPETPFYALHLVRHRDELNQRDIVVRGKRDAETRGDGGENSFVGTAEAEIPKARLNLRLKRPIVTLSILNGAVPHIYSNDWLLPERVLPFLKAGASAVVGTWWQTTEAAERVFWSRFYDLLANGLPLGEVVWRSRLAVQRALPHSPDWLAYTLLGNPRAKPYEPEDSMGYTALECLSADEPLQPGKTYYFRASIRTRPPVWYKDRLIQPEALTNNLTALFLAPGLEITESEPIPMQPAGRTMRQATVPLTAPEPGNYVLRVQLFEDEEYLKTLSMTLKVADLSGEEMVNG